MSTEKKKSCPEISLIQCGADWTAPLSKVVFACAVWTIQAQVVSLIRHLQKVFGFDCNNNFFCLAC